MKRKYDGNHNSGSKVDPSPVDLKDTKLTAKFELKRHKKELQSRDSLGDGDKGKEKDTSQSKFDSLPLELKLDVLTRLPAKSLMKSESVSKMWSSIIQSRDFVRSFFSVSSTRPRLIVALSNGLVNARDEMLVFFFSFSPEDEEESSFSVPNFEMAINSVDYTNFSGSCTSVHGLLTVEAGCRLTICNPSTEQFIRLPEGTKFVGYDPIDDQYKAFTVYRDDDYTTVHKVLTLGESGRWRRIKPPSMMPYYSPTRMGISINGFIYYGAYSPKRPTNPGIVRFDVRSEKLTYIKAPEDVVYYCNLGTLIDYKGKLASIVRDPYKRFQTFDLWVLEDDDKHEWSLTKCVFPLSVWDFAEGVEMCFPGINKAGDIIMAPMLASLSGQPYYIFYYNVETQNIRRVRLRGIGDNQEFSHSYGLLDKGECHVRIAPQHVESINFFKNIKTLPELSCKDK